MPMGIDSGSAWTAKAGSDPPSFDVRSKSMTFVTPFVGSDFADSNRNHSARLFARSTRIVHRARVWVGLGPRYRSRSPKKARKNGLAANRGLKPRPRK